MHSDYLGFKSQICLVNCEVEADRITCGLAYLAPNTPPFLPLFDLESRQICVIEIPSQHQAEPNPRYLTCLANNIEFKRLSQ